MTMNFLRRSLLEYSLIFFVLLGDSVSAFASSDQKLNIVASFSVLADLAEQVGGDRVEVFSIVPREAEVHGFDLSPHHLMKIGKAQLLILNGGDLDHWLKRRATGSEFKAKQLVLMDDAPLIAGDPHCWQDIDCGEHYARRITEALVSIAPADSKYFQATLATYLSKLAETRTKLMAIYKQFEGTTVLSPHQGLAYLERRSGLQLINLRGVNRNSEESAKHRGATLITLKEKNVRIALAEAGMHDRSYKQFAKDANLILTPPLYVESLAKSGEASTYVGMMLSNANTILMTTKSIGR